MAGTDTPISEAERTSAVHVVRLICVDNLKNHNKFWHAYVFPDGNWAAEYGRVGDAKRRTDRHSAGNVAVATTQADRKAQSKRNYTGKKRYVDQRTVEGGNVPQKQGARVADGEVRATAIQEIDFGNNRILRDMIMMLADVNVHTITSNSNIKWNAAAGTFTTELGLVTPDGIDDARDLLAVIARHVKDLSHPDADQAINSYLEIVPQDVGRKRGWADAYFGQNDSMQKQMDLLDSLTASLQQVQSAPKDANKEGPVKRVFDVRLELVESGRILDQLRRKFKSSKGDHYAVSHLDLKQAFAIEIASVKAAFESRGRKLGNIKQHWHGTKASNLLSIFKVGLIIPRSGSAHVTGRMFGDGVYGSEQSTKALNYATNLWSGGGNTDRTFMLLVEFAMGREHHPRSWGGHFPASGTDSTYVKGGTAGVANQESIVYDTSQVNTLYLCEFTRGGR